MTDVRSLLHDLADEAPAGQGTTTADRVVVAHRSQDRRRLRWAGVAAGVAVVVAVTPVVADTIRPVDSAATSASQDGAADLGLYDLPPRGSLAGDDGLLTQALAASWDDGIPQNDGGRVLDPAEDTRRVSFLGEVPGGQVWALVLARTGTQLAYAWFADVEASDGVALELVGSPQRTFPDTPVGLLDTARATGPLVVVSSPGDEVDYSPDGSGGATGEPPVYRSLDTTDGVAVAEVEVPDGAAAFPGYRVARDDLVVYRQPPTAFDSTLPLGPYVEPDVPTVLRDPVYGPLVASCLTGLGWNVTASSDGSFGLAFPASQGVAVLFAADVAACEAQVGYR